MKNVFLFLVIFISAAASAVNAFAQPCYTLTENATICNGEIYTFPDGTTQTITAQVIYTSYLQTVQTQCDSLIETTVNPLPTYNQTQSFFNICPGINYTFPDGYVQTITEHTEYTSYLQTAGSQCDSVILTILNTTDIDSNVTVSGNLLTANQGNAGYQWLDCSNGFAPVSGAGNQSYNAPDGSYAVIIYKGNCIDTSACYAVGTVGMQNLNANDFYIYPNPAATFITIESPKTSGIFQLHDITGKQLMHGIVTTVKYTLDISALSKGIYLFSFFNGEEMLHSKFQKE